jgi:hypothetical protein
VSSWIFPFVRQDSASSFVFTDLQEDRALDAMQGKRLSEIADEQKKDPLETLFDLILADHGQTGAIYFMMNEADLRAAMRARFASFCTDSEARAVDGPLAGAKSHPRGGGPTLASWAITFVKSVC